ncbi:hypothetical protein MRX96_047285 [Rhipicephalus microplus]
MRWFAQFKLGRHRRRTSTLLRSGQGLDDDQCLGIIRVPGRHLLPIPTKSIGKMDGWTSRQWVFPGSRL